MMMFGFTCMKAGVRQY